MLPFGGIIMIPLSQKRRLPLDHLGKGKMDVPFPVGVTDSNRQGEIGLLLHNAGKEDSV